jgi:methyl-accepting chemotaxis protein
MANRIGEIAHMVDQTSRAMKDTASAATGLDDFMASQLDETLGRYKV